MVYMVVYFTGYVTTYHAEDLELMHDLLHREITPIEKAGIHPTADQVTFTLFVQGLLLYASTQYIYAILTICREMFF